MAKSRFDRLPRANQRVLRWWIDGRALENDDSDHSRTLTADRVSLMERDPTYGIPGDIIAEWNEPNECVIYLPDHPAGAALADELDRWGISYTTTAPATA